MNRYEPARTERYIRAGKINFAFFGTDEFAVTILEELKNAGLIPALIVTTPDQSKGRRLRLTSPPVKLWAQETKVEFIQPTSLKTLDDQFRRLSRNPDLASGLLIVASYGKIIPKDILAIPEHGTLNIHPSLLPKYRGPTPIQTAILNGDEETGVTVMLLDEKMDHGPLLGQRKYQMTNLPDDKAGSKLQNYLELRDELARTGGKLLAETIPNWLAGKIKAREQDHNQATFTKMITKSDGEIRFEDIEQKPLEIYRKFLAYTPWPGIYFFDNLRGEECAENLRRVKITAAHLEPSLGGETSKLVIDRVIPANKKEISWKDHQRGY